MRTIIGMSVLFWLLLTAAGLMTARAEAREVATRCGSYGCSVIVCNRTGDRCRRFDRDRGDWYDRGGWRNRPWYGDRRYRRGDWNMNCDPDNPTCLERRSENRLED
jgi:hypothetical protein